MFRSRSNYISEKSSYTDIRNQLHRAYQKKGANARIRFVEGHGLYIKNEKADWRKSFDSDDDKKERQAKFDGAKENLKAAIDREYDGWKVDGLSMGQHVVNNLTTPPDGDGLDEKALKDIDALIAEGMKSAAANLEQVAQDDSPRRRIAAKEARGRIQEARDRNAIFENLESVRTEEASRNRLQRWWARHFGDNQAQADLDRAFDRARNWRAIVHGNQLLSEAIEEDLSASGYRGDRQAKAREILNKQGLLRSGLTPKSHNAVVQSLGAQSYSTSNVQALGAYVDLTQNARTNIGRLRRLNGSIDQILKTMNFGDANRIIREALDTSDDALSEAVGDLNSGRLSDEHHRANLYGELQRSFQLLCEARRSLVGVETKQNARALDRLTGFIDEHLVVTHDLARAVLEVSQDGFDEHDENFRLPIKDGVNLVADFPAGSLIDGLPQPKTLFQSTARKMKGDAMPETAYNEACRRVSNALNTYKRSLSGPRIDEQLKYLGKLRRRAAEASRLNDQFVIAFGRQTALGGSAHAAVNTHLQDQRADLHMLKLNCVQEQLRLEKEQARRGRRRDLNPLESDSNSSVSNKSTEKFVSPRPGMRGVYRDDSRNDDIYENASTDVFSGNGGGNESLLSFGDSSNSAGSSVDEQHDRNFSVYVASAKSRGTAIGRAATKVVSPDFDSLASPSTVGIVVNIPDGSDSAGSAVQTPAGGASVLSWGRKNSPNPDSMDSPRNAEEPEYSLANFPGANSQLPIYDGHLLDGAFRFQLARPLSGLPEEPADQYARRSAFADQPQFVRTVSSETIGDAPRPGLLPQTSQMSFVSNPGTENSFDQLKLGLNTTTVNTLNNEAFNEFGDENDETESIQNRDAKYDAGHILGTSIKEDGFEFLDDETEYAGSDENGPDESGSPSTPNIKTPEPDEPHSSGTGAGSASAQDGSPSAQREARISRSSRQ